MRRLGFVRLDVDRDLGLRQMHSERFFDAVAQRMRFGDAHRAGDEQVQLEKAPRSAFARAQRVKARLNG